VHQPKLDYLAKPSFIIEREMKPFYNRQKLKERMTTRPALQTALIGTLYMMKKIDSARKMQEKNKPH
jgi:hypothetical protein